MASRQTDRQTDRQTHTHTHRVQKKQFQETSHVWPAHEWFKKHSNIYAKKKYNI